VPAVALGPAVSQGHGQFVLAGPAAAVLRGEQVGGAPADDLGGGVPEDVLGPAVPAGHDPVSAEQDDGVVLTLDQEEAEELVGPRPGRVARPAAVVGDRGRASGASVGVTILVPAVPGRSVVLG
jgi:hypothetical protein